MSLYRSLISCKGKKNSSYKVEKSNRQSIIKSSMKHRWTLPGMIF